MFIETSKVPIAAPKKKSATASRSGLEAIARNGSTRQENAPLDSITVRQPKRDANIPAAGMATIDPIPRNSRRSPSSDDSNAIRDLANGTNAAQADVPMPAARNARRVDKRCIDRQATWAFSRTGILMTKWMSGICEANGINIHYMRTGGSKPPLVL